MSTLLLILLLLASGALPQTPSRDAIFAASKTIAANARYATFITNGPNGQPSARIVDPFQPEGDLTIWVATNAASRKVAELRASSRVTLLYFDAANKGYVSLLGKAVIVSDAAMKAKYWKDEWTGMYTDKHRGDDYLLIRVEPETLEVVSVALGMVNDPLTWKPVTLKIR